MALLLVLVLLLHASPALGQSVVEVESGSPSVLLSFWTEPPGEVVWTRGLQEVHRKVQRGDDFRKQDPHFLNRTRIKPDALQSGDVSLELLFPSLTDDGSYLCVTSKGDTEVSRHAVQLKVKGVQVSVTEGSQVVLPFLMRAMETEATVRWSREPLEEPLEEQVVHVREGSRDDPAQQSSQFKGRTQMKSDALRSGDVGLVLQSSAPSDSGLYKCVVTGGGTELARTTVELIVKPPPPIPLIVILVLLSVLVLLLSVVLFLTVKRKKQTKENFKDAFTGLLTCRSPPSVL